MHASIAYCMKPIHHPCLLADMFVLCVVTRRAERRGIYILYEDVKSCPCEDVHILWSILVDSSHSRPPPMRLDHH